MNRPNKHRIQPDESSQPMTYQIRIQGHLSRQWIGWFDGLAITLEDNGDTLVTGAVVDQAALHGLLKKVRDLGLPLISVNRIEPDPADAVENRPAAVHPVVGSSPQPDLPERDVESTGLQTS